MTALRLADLVERFGGQLIGDGDYYADIEVTAIAPLDQAGPQHVSFLSNIKLRDVAATSHAAALILSSADDAVIGARFAGSRIVTPNPYAYFARVAQLFAQLNATPISAATYPAASARFRWFLNRLAVSDSIGFVQGSKAPLAAYPCGSFRTVRVITLAAIGNVPAQPRD